EPEGGNGSRTGDCRVFQDLDGPAFPVWDGVCGRRGAAAFDTVKPAAVCDQHQPAAGQGGDASEGHAGRLLPGADAAVDSGRGDGGTRVPDEPAGERVVTAGAADQGEGGFGPDAPDVFSTGGRGYVQEDGYGQ